MLNLHNIFRSKKWGSFTTTNYPLDNKGHYSLLFGQAQYNPSMYNRNGFSCWSAMQNKENAYTQMMFLYDHTNKNLYQSYWGENTSGDYHANANTVILPDGRILTATDSSHNSVTVIKRSLTAYDINSYEEITSITGGNPAYPNLALIGSRIYCFTRGFSERNFICWSDDNGETFSTPIQVSQLATSNDWAYPRLIFSETKLKVLVNRRDQPTTDYSAVYYYETTDGINWNNSANSFSKNISTSGFITAVEMDANYKLGDFGFVGSALEISSTEIIIHVDNKIIKTSSGSSTETNLVNDLYYDFIVGGKSQLLKKDSFQYLIGFARLIADDSLHLVILKSNDLFQSFSITVLSQGNNNPITAFNFSETGQTLICAKRPEVYTSGPLQDPDNSYSSMDVFKLKEWSDNSVFFAIYPIANLMASPGNTSTSIKVNFIAPLALNGIDHYEVWLNGVFYENTTDSSDEWIITGLTVSTSYDIKLKVVDALGNKSEFSNEVTQSTASPLILDQVAGFIHAYSHRKLRNAYAGSAIRVRRSSDSTTSDIGFVSDELDETTLTTFTGANDGLKDRFYDQAGSRDLQQTTAANQPKIVNAGAVVKVTGKPYSQYDGTNDFMQSFGTSIPITDANSTVFVIFESQTSNTIQEVFQERKVTLNNNNRIVSDTRNIGFAQINYSPNGTGNLVSFVSQQPQTTKRCFILRKTGTTIEGYDENGLIGSIVSADTFSSVNTLLYLGVHFNAAPINHFGGKIAELLINNTALSPTDQTTVLDNIKTYYSIP